MSKQPLVVDLTDSPSKAKRTLNKTLLPLENDAFRIPAGIDFSMPPLSDTSWDGIFQSSSLEKNKVPNGTAPFLGTDPPIGVDLGPHATDLPIPNGASTTTARFNDFEFSAADYSPWQHIFHDSVKTKVSTKSSDANEVKATKRTQSKANDSSKANAPMTKVCVKPTSTNYKLPTTYETPDSSKVVTQNEKAAIATSKKNQSLLPQATKNVWSKGPRSSSKEKNQSKELEREPANGKSTKISANVSRGQSPSSRWKVPRKRPRLPSEERKSDISMTQKSKDERKFADYLSRGEYLSSRLPTQGNVACAGNIPMETRNEVIERMSSSQRQERQNRKRKKRDAADDLNFNGVNKKTKMKNDGCAGTREAYYHGLQDAKDTAVFLKNLPEDMTREEIETVFETQELKNTIASLQRNDVCNFWTVKFSSKDSRDQALALSGKAVLSNGPLIIEPWERIKASFKEKQTGGSHLLPPRKGTDKCQGGNECAIDLYIAAPQTHAITPFLIQRFFYSNANIEDVIGVHLLEDSTSNIGGLSVQITFGSSKSLQKSLRLSGKRIGSGIAIIRRRDVTGSTTVQAPHAAIETSANSQKELKEISCQTEREKGGNRHQENCDKQGKLHDFTPQEWEEPTREQSIVESREIKLVIAKDKPITNDVISDASNNLTSLSSTVSTSIGIYASENYHSNDRKEAIAFLSASADASHESMIAKKMSNSSCSMSPPRSQNEKATEGKTNDVQCCGDLSSNGVPATDAANIVLTPQNKSRENETNGGTNSSGSGDDVIIIDSDVDETQSPLLKRHPNSRLPSLSDNFVQQHNYVKLTDTHTGEDAYHQKRNRHADKDAYVENSSSAKDKTTAIFQDKAKATVPITEKERMSTFDSDEACHIDSNEAKISSYLEHVHGFRKQKENDLGGADSFESIKGKTATNNTLPSKFVKRNEDDTDNDVVVLDGLTSKESSCPVLTDDEVELVEDPMNVFSLGQVKDTSDNLRRKRFRASKPKKPTPKVQPERRYVFHTSNQSQESAKKSTWQDTNFNANLTHEDALRQQERLFRESAARVRSQARVHVTSYQGASRSFTFSSPMLDVRNRFPEHWKFTDPYARLGLPKNSSINLVKAHYRNLARLYHPDKSGSDETAPKFQAVAEAYRHIRAFA